jgi:hypothetical protein
MFAGATACRAQGAREHAGAPVPAPFAVGQQTRQTNDAVLRSDAAEGEIRAFIPLWRDKNDGGRIPARAIRPPTTTQAKFTQTKSVARQPRPNRTRARNCAPDRFGKSGPLTRLAPWRVHSQKHPEASSFSSSFSFSFSPLEAMSSTPVRLLPSFAQTATGASPLQSEFGTARSRSRPRDRDAADPPIMIKITSTSTTES